MRQIAISNPTLRRLYFSLFALSGFAGLIYESIWTHYLKLFLGHAAYAQTLVLIIFMGGMALGAWAASH
jgi:Na+/melibiose symporter-like transporter